MVLLFYLGAIMRPKQHIRLLYEHFDLISAIYHEVNDQPFHEALVFKLQRNLSPSDYSIEHAYKILETLKREGIVEALPGSAKEYEFFHPLVTFIESLLSEQKLSLHAELIVRVQALITLRGKLEASIIDRDLMAYHGTCNEMDRLLRTLKGQVDDSMQAVYRLVEEAKSFPKDMPLKKRYSRTLDAWDTFVSPVLEMCNPSTPFSQNLTITENSLQGWLDDHSLQFLALDSDRKRIEVLRIRLIDFLESLSKAVDDMGKQIYPIVRMVRLNNQVTRGATLALRHISQTSSKAWVQQLGVGLTKAVSNVRHGSSAKIEAMLRVLIANADKGEQAPSISKDDLIKVVSNQKERSRHQQQDIISAMRKRLPLNNAISIMRRDYPEISLKMLLTCFASVARTPGYTVVRDPSSTIQIEFDLKVLSFANRHIVKAKV